MSRKLKEAADLAAKKISMAKLDFVKDVPVVAVDKGQYEAEIKRMGDKFLYTGYLSKSGELPLWVEPQKADINIDSFVVKKAKEDKEAPAKAVAPEAAAPKKAVVKKPAAAKPAVKAPAVLPPLK